MNGSLTAANTEGLLPRSIRLAIPLLLASVAFIAAARWYRFRVLFDMAEFLHPAELPEMYLELALTSSLHGVLIALVPLLAACVLRSWISWLVLAGMLLNYTLVIFGVHSAVSGWVVVAGLGVVLTLVAFRAPAAWRGAAVPGDPSRADE